MIYRLVLSIRHFLYDKGFRKSAEADVPTVCVGNITVGGTGKTPHTEMILKMLLRSDDWAYSEIAVLSRGYKRKTKGFQKVSREGTAAEFGDEPLQIAKKFPAVTVAVDKDRVEGCRFLTRPETLQTDKKARGCADKILPKADIIVLDDAFQYRKLRAKVNIVLVDYNRPVHKDRLLPWGHLRDLRSRLRKADIIIVTKCPAYLDEWEREKWGRYVGLQDGQTLLFSTMQYKAMQPVFPEADSRFIYSRRLVLFSGIARDAQLRCYLSDTYKIVKRFGFHDHHKYSGADIRKILRAVKENSTACVVTTEKDAQRIVDVKKMPAEIRERLFMIPIEAVFLTKEEETLFSQVLQEKTGSRSVHERILHG